MKSLEELSQVMETGDIGDIIPEKIAEQVEEAARELRVGRQLCRINTDLMNTEGNTISIPKRGTIEAADASEGASPDTTFSTYTEEVNVTVKKIEAGVAITQESIEDAKFDVINGNLSELSHALANKEDKDIMEELMAVGTGDATVELSSDETGELGEENILEIISAVNEDDDDAPVDIEVDYTTGDFKLVTTGITEDNIKVEFKYVDGDIGVVDASKKGDAGRLELGNIIDARTKVAGKKYQPNALVIDEDGRGEILQDDDFIDASKYGEQVNLMNGEIGRIAGMPVLVSTQVPNRTALVVDTRNAAVFVNKRDPYVKREEKADTDSIEIYARQRYNPSRLTDDATCVITGFQNNAVEEF